MSARLFQCQTPTGITKPMTAPEALEWARFHNMRFNPEPTKFAEFVAVPCDLGPLTKDELRVFSACDWR